MMSMKDNLTSPSPWERAKALYQVKENHLKDPDILFLTLRLLDGDEFINVPDKIRQEDLELAGQEFFQVFLTGTSEYVYLFCSSRSSCKQILSLPLH